MRVTGIHHVAFAHGTASDVDDRLLAVLGLSVAHEEQGPGFTERMLPVGDCYVQTLEVTGPGTVERFVERRGDGLHHLAFTVDDIDAAVRELRDAGVELIDSVPRDGGMQTRIAFIHPRAVGGLLVELVQDPSIHH